MKNITNKIIALPLLAIAFLPALTNAANVNLNMNVGIGGERPGGNMPERMGTSSRGWNNGTTTGPLSARPSKGGIITAIKGLSFTIDAPSKNGTTTITVNTDANTAFRSGTTTTALASLTVGQRVSVLGEYATTTNTIAAKQVTVLNIRHMDNRDGNKPQGFFGRFFSWMKKLF